VCKAVVKKEAIQNHSVSVGAGVCRERGEEEGKRGRGNKTLRLI
jgi:hypothetical protein